MGDVFLGVHVELGSFVAVKVLNAAASAEPHGVARFLAEAKAVAAIDHDQIARVIDQDRLPDGTPYIVMEFVEGVTLRELLEERGPLGLRLTVELMLDVLSALTVAHARGIVHRDLKPENLRVTKSGRAKILDFGIAKRLHDAPTPLTQQGMLVGTPYYMSPEQIAGGAIDGRSDLYAVGVILFECVTGQRPFEGSTVVALLNRHLTEAPSSPRAVRPEVTLALESVILRALEKQPVLRFGSADELATALRRTFDELPEDGPIIRRIREPQELATPSMSMPQGTTEDALGNTVRTPVTRRFRRPLPIAVLLLCVLGIIALPLLAKRGEGPPANPATSTPPPVPVATSTATLVPLPETALPAPVLPKPVTRRLKAAAPLPAEKVIEDAGAAPEVTAPKGVQLIKTSSDATSLPIEFDPRSFDALAFLNRAQALARERMPDAVLITFDVMGLFDGDRVDLTASKQFEANYWFRSPAKSLANPRLRDEDQDIPCLLYVVVNAKKIELHAVTSSNSCKEKQLPRIACSISAVTRQAKTLGFETTMPMKFTWLSDGWYVDLGADRRSETVACP